MRYKSKQILLILLSVFLMFVAGRIFPPLQGMTQDGFSVVLIFIGSLLLWLGVSTTWSAMLCLVALCTVPTLSCQTVFANSFGSWIFVYLLGVFLMTHALSQTPFLRRCTLFFLSRRTARKGPWQFLLLFFAAALLMGLFVTSEVVFMVFLAIAEEIFAELQIRPGEKIATAVVLGLIFVASVTSGMTPIAHVFPLLIISFYTKDFGQTISLGKYMAFAIPVGLLILLCGFLLIRFVLRPDMSKLAALRQEQITEMRDKLPPATDRERISVGMFALCIVLWLLPDLLRNAWPAASTFFSGQGTALPALLAAAVLAMLQIDGEPVLQMSEALRKGVPWEALLMVSAVCALGAATSNPDIGLVAYLTEKLAPLVSRLQPFAFVLAVSLISVLMTNLTSNVVTGTVVYAIAIPMAMGTDAFCSAELLTCIIGAGIAFAFATPSATSHVTIACSTEWIETKAVAQYGFLLAILAAVILATLGTTLLGVLFN